MKKNWESPTNEPINIPTNNPLWYFRITIVPPIPRSTTRIADHVLRIDSFGCLLYNPQADIISEHSDSVRMEYLPYCVWIGIEGSAQKIMSEKSPSI